MRPHRVRAVVLGCVIPGELRIVLEPGVGHVDGGVHSNIATQIVPVELRMPNSCLWIDFDAERRAVRVLKRRED
jgi:hypothetical protein